MAPQESDFPPHADPNLDTYIIGVDVGLTYTGVSYCSVHESTICTVKSWTGTWQSDTHEKVPTAVGYAGGDTRVKSWGFECASRVSENGIVTSDRFKLMLDEDTYRNAFERQPDKAPGAEEDVRRWFRDFLRKLYEHVCAELMEEFKLISWESAIIHFVFSIPTLWERRSVAEVYKEIVKEAGFGVGGRSHSVEFNLNEAEAAAIYTAIRPKPQQSEILRDESISPVVRALAEATEAPRLKKGDVMLVVDAGGGTTDIATEKIESITHITVTSDMKEEIANLTTLDYNKDIRAIGSVRIDDDFGEIVTQRLEKVPSAYFSKKSLKHVVDEIVHGDTIHGSRRSFQNVKLNFGKDETASVPNFRFVVPNLPSDFSLVDAAIKNGHMVFPRDEIASLFDKQVNGMFELIDSQLTPRDIVITQIVLAGGLGSSHYVQRKILERYGPGSRGIQILVSNQPQLAVCKGLVIDKLHRLKHNHNVLPMRYCRASYGIVYHRRVAHRMSMRLNPFRTLVDGDQYSDKYVSWLIKQGQPIRRDRPISHRFWRIITKDVLDCFSDYGTIDFTDEIVISRTPSERLPLGFDEGDVDTVGMIRYELPTDLIQSSPSRNTNFTTPFSAASCTAITHRKRKIKFLRRIPEHWKIELELRMFVESASLKFEMLCGDRQIGGPIRLTVHWWYTSRPGVSPTGNWTSAEMNPQGTASDMGPLCGSETIDEFTNSLGRRRL